jgi:predicted deacylase
MVHPSYVKKEKIPIKHLPSGDHLHWNKWFFQGSQSDCAPSVYLQASLHGSEVQGNLCLSYLIDYLMVHQPLGDIICLPLCNPSGLNHKQGEYTQGRYDTLSGTNWNRAFWLPVTLEVDDHLQKEELSLPLWIKQYAHLPLPQLVQKYKNDLHTTMEKKLQRHEKDCHLEYPSWLALKLQQQAVKADLILDLHTGPTSTTYLYSFHDLVENAKNLLLSPIISIPDLFAGAMDEVMHIPWSFLKKFIPTINNHEAYTLELGSQEWIDQKKAIKDTQRLIHYLKNKQVIDARSPDLEQIEKPQHFIRSLENYKAIFSPKAGLVTIAKKPGSFFKENELLATIYQFENYPFSYCIKAPHNLYLVNHTPSAIIHQGQELCRYLKV